MCRLALDLGTNTGFCVGTAGLHISGHWSLKPGRFDGGGMRFVKFRQRLNEIHAAYPVTIVSFEEVRRHKGTDAAHVFGGLLAILTEWCETNAIPYEGIPVGTIKREWTGRGNADKAAMIAAAVERGYAPNSDDEADAIAIFCIQEGLLI
jgi:Holliday junction resolvasome RuvABC endonuclease subunit